MREIDPVHRRARADQRVERQDRLVRVLLGEAVHEVDLGADRDRRTSRRSLDGLDDVARRADLVGHGDRLVWRLWVDHDDAVRVLGAERGDLLGREPLVDRAVALPEEEGGVLGLGLGQPAQVEARVPQRHVVVRVAHRDPGVAPEVLVREEQHLVSLGERPPQHRLGIARRADGAAVTAHERLDGRRRVHVRDRHEALDVDDVCEGLPRLLDLVDVGHVGHGAAGVEVRQDDLLVVAGQDVGGFRHEVHPAEDDVFGFGPFLRENGQLVAVAPSVGEGDDLVALVVVSEDEEALAERLLRPGHTLGEFVERRVGVPVRQRELESEHGWVPRSRGVEDPIGGR